MYGAYDAFNLTEVTGPIHIANCTVHKGRGLLWLCENMLSFVRPFEKKAIPVTVLAEGFGVGHDTHIFKECVSVCVCVCVCVCERERESQPDRRTEV